jgi:uncharacterized membrane protein YeaQ/YmgE (transglycosylase-associated protein family)
MNISLLGFLALLAIAAIVGFVAKAIVGFHRGGLLAAIGLGFAGGLIGIILADATNLPELVTINIGGMMFPLVWALLGTILLVAVVALATRGAYTGPRRRWGW